MNNYKLLLANIKKSYSNFIQIAEKIVVEDESPEMMSLKSQSMIYNIELRSLLNKFRNAKCNCQKK